MDILKYIDQLEELVDSAPKVPLSGKIMVNLDEIFEIVDLIRDNLPQELRDAQYALLEKDRILTEAQQKADRMIEEAKNEARSLVVEHEIVRRAQSEAESIMSKTRENAIEVREGARAYANDILYQIENNLDKALYIVKKSRDEIRSGTAGTSNGSSVGEQK